MWSLAIEHWNVQLRVTCVRSYYQTKSVTEVQRVRTVCGAPCFTANTPQVSSNFFTQAHMVFREGTRTYRPTLNCRLKTRCTCHRLRFLITTKTGNTLLRVQILHYDWLYEMASSLLFPFLPPKTSYCAGAIFNFEMCQSAPRHLYIYFVHRDWYMLNLKESIRLGASL
jgi:hypothetical protein